MLGDGARTCGVEVDTVEQFGEMGAGGVSVGGERGVRGCGGCGGKRQGGVAEVEGGLEDDGGVGDRVVLPKKD